MNYIIWKGINSNSINGLMICELPPITKPQMRYKETEVDGVDGSLVEQLGYSSYTKEIEIGLYGNYDIDEIIDYFSGSGQLIMSNEEDKYYNASILAQIDYKRLIRFRTAKVKFLVQPYKYDANETALSVDVSGTSATIVNSGNAIAKPIITLKGSGTIAVKKDDITIFEYTFDDDGAVTIDSEKQDAYNGIVLKNRNMNGDFLGLKQGANVISWTGTLTEFTISKYGRWL